MITQDEVRQQFSGAVEEIRGAVEPFDDMTPLAEVGIDSLDLIEVAMMLEDGYGIVLDEKAFDGATVVGDVLNVVTQRINCVATPSANGVVTQ